MSTNADRVLSIKRRLRRTWNYFFQRFGNLLPIQLVVIPKVLEGKNLVVCSPTASGKTEAIVAPVAERLLADGLNGLAVLYVTPTRALANDLYVRLNEPLSDLGISLKVKTGDKPYFDPRDPEDFVITTPESFDSLLCRHPDVFKNLKVIIIDELHLLDGNYRGDQLRVLLERLRKKGLQTNYHILSATLANPEKTASRYCSDFEVVQMTGQREILYELIEASNIVDGLSRVLSALSKRGAYKALFFCNSRRDTEFIGQQLMKMLRDTDLDNRVGIHHGSLSRRQRLDIEQAMREEKCFYCVSTPTLEIGIDIGDIDAVVLVHPPFTISSLLQRVGRGNRQKNYILAYGLYSDADECRLFKQMFTAAQKGEIKVTEYLPSISVIVQQSFSMLFELRKAHLNTLKEHLCLLNTEEKIEAILSHLGSLGYVEFAGDWVYPTTKLLDEAEKGWIHSNIPDERDVKVIDVLTKHEIGHITIDPFKGVMFVLGGKTWKVESVHGENLYVKEVKEPGAIPYFSRRRSEGRYFRLLPPETMSKISIEEI